MHRSGLVELEAVVAVARRGNFRAAAADLGMSSSALSHAVRGLEARLGVRLFNRTTRSVSLSAAGEQFVAGVAPALSDIRGAMEAVNRHRDTPAGTLRLNTSAGAARRILTPIILEYLRRYPEMKVDLVTEGRLIDIVVDGFDAGIRMAETVPGDMIAVPVGGALRFAVVAAPAYFADRPRPQTPGDLMAHRCIRARMPSGVIYRWEFERRGEALALDVPGPIILDEPTLMIEAALAGLGVAYLSEWSVLADIAAGRLVRVLEDWTPSFAGLALYYPGRRHVPAGLRAFIDLVREVGELPDRRVPA
ncbi:MULTISPECIES: LysR family transcriptional regulator [Inquilinus]|uniref:DNA-binding transcriptional LysR family regulator n=1 Tax=Inquilinus ginsengisoli TaxID=363840 RepID=A0ABU1JP99_9PROT|nr:LysR family transcriptional regulator [Inquilinus ginsengisoli]MDR6290450.1 DNA-binding transcriptional LysR family regulator [Inquilinus ginsengisoli]